MFGESVRVLQRSGKFLVVLTLVLTTGAHWAALQTIAWTKMLANNLCTQSVTEAVANTFDGEHPCPICKAIAAAKKAQQKAEFALQSQKLEYPPPSPNFLPVAPSRFQWLPLAHAFADTIPAQPLTPPPRIRHV
jgi:hypothetical protein